MGWIMYALLIIAGLLVGTMGVGLLARKSWQIIAPGLLLVPIGIWIIHDGRYMDKRYLFYGFLLFIVAFLAAFLAEDWRRIPV